MVTKKYKDAALGHAHVDFKHGSSLMTIYCRNQDTNIVLEPREAARLARDIIKWLVPTYDWPEKFRSKPSPLAVRERRSK